MPNADMIEATVHERPARTKAAQQAPEATPARKATLAKLMERMTESEKGGTPIRRRKMKLTISKDVCQPGAFDQDFYLILESPSTEIELAALKRYAQDNPGAVPHEMCRLSIIECDGQRVSDANLTRDALWQALGSLGRSLVLMKWNELSGGSNVNQQEALKKMGETAEILI